MSGHRFQTVTRQSWGSRIGKSIGGIFVGLLLFLVAFPLLYWNESRTVNRARALHEGRGAVVALSRTDPVDPGSEGQLVWLSGEAVTDETLRDDEFAARANAVRLRRLVEMYQWVEESERQTSTNVGGSTETVTTYNYTKQWKDQPVDSGRFAQSAEYVNPPMPFGTREWLAQRVSLGAFQLSPGLVGQIAGAQPLVYEEDWWRALPEAMRAEWIVADGGLYRPVAAAARAPSEDARGGEPEVPTAPDGLDPADEASFAYSVDTWSADTLDAPPLPADAPLPAATGAAEPEAPPQRPQPTTPEIGDLRVRFEVIRPQVVSVIAQQAGDGLRAYQPQSSSSAIELLAMGSVSADAMFARAERENTMLAWLLRLAGFALMAVGIGMVLAPIGVLADVIPFVGRLTRLGTGLIAFVLAAVLSTVTIAVAWVLVRPLLGLTLFAVALLILVGGIMAAKRRPPPKTE